MELKDINISKLADAVAQAKYYNNIIEEEKIKIRQLSKKDLEKLKQNNLVIVDTSTYPKKTYSKEYKDAVAELKVKYPPKVERIADYSIELTPTSFTIRKAELIRQFTDNNITTLQRIMTDLKRAKTKKLSTSKTKSKK